MTVVHRQPTLASAPAAPSRLLGEVLVAGMFVLLAQTVRPLLTLVYEVGEDSGYGPVTVIVAGAFALPLASGAATRIGLPARAELLGVAAASAALLALLVVDPIPLWLGATAAGASLAGMALVVHGVHVGTGEPHWLAIGMLLGLAADTGLRAAFRTWDLVWQPGTMAHVAGAALIGVVVVTAILVGRTAGLGGGRDTHRPRALAALGPVLMLQLVFLQNPAFVASQGGLSLAAAVAVVLAGDLLVLLALPAERHLPHRSLELAGVAGVLLAAMLPSIDGFAVVPAVVAIQLVIWLNLARALSAAPVALVTLRRVAVGTVAGAEAFLLLVFLWQVDVVSPLPFPRAVLPGVAVALVALTALRASRARPPRVAPRRVVLAALAAWTIAVPAALWLDRPGRDLVAAREQIRLVSYNVRGSVSTTGQLRPDLVAAEIASSAPDVVVLQEVGRGMPVHGALDLLAFLEDRLEMTALYQPAADGQLGNAILSRLPITEVGGTRLPHAGSQARSYLLATVEVGDHDLTLLATHLQRSSEQIEAVLRVVGGVAPAIIAGDLNVDPGDELLSAFDGYTDVVAASGDPCRTTSAEPTSVCDRPDWVLVTPDVVVEDVRIGTSHASDHLPIHATLTVT